VATGDACSRPRPFGRGTVLFLLATAAVALGGPAAAAEPAAAGQSVNLGVATTSSGPSRSTGRSAPQLSISIDNGKTAVSPGDTLRYTLTIRNVGSTDVHGLVVTQTIPGGSSLRSADAKGTLRSGTVSWKADVKAASAITFHTTVAVRDPPKDLLRLATVACAALSAKDAPLVCASHSDLLPAGAVSQGAEPTSGEAPGSAAAGASALPGASASAAASSAPAADRSRPIWWLIGGGAVVLIIAAVGVLLLRRGRQRQG
jgi:uncharacterized repeat protein (TIGR01451 family)